MAFYDAKMPTLYTEHLLIRRFSEEDLCAFHGTLTGDPDWWDRGTIEDARESLTFRIRQTRYNNPPLGYRAVVLQESQILIGTVGYDCYFLGREERCLFDESAYAQDSAHRTLEFGVGYFIAAEHRSRGFGAEAVRALIDFAFESIGVQRLWAETWHENRSSIELMKRVGMRVGRNPDPEAWPGVFGVIERPPDS
ncbi:MAG: GNAT family N-acetyltransferase [Gemmatimonadetes bacterium]|jgi:RimJ/RimL family protein N-acetyltransferase|nr:GNAT family N-acetyltransferase [Gemmatimonadota bacterium]